MLHRSDLIKAIFSRPVLTGTSSPATTANLECEGTPHKRPVVGGNQAGCTALTCLKGPTALGGQRPEVLPAAAGLRYLDFHFSQPGYNRHGWRSPRHRPVPVVFPSGEPATAKLHPQPLPL